MFLELMLVVKAAQSVLGANAGCQGWLSRLLKSW